MKIKIIKTSVTSEMVSQSTICVEMEGSSKEHKVPEITRMVLRVSNKDKEHADDQSSDIEGVTEVELVKI